VDVDTRIAIVSRITAVRVRSEDANLDGIGIINPIANRLIHMDEEHLTDVTLGIRVTEKTLL
jgi:hypothetical protein